MKRIAMAVMALLLAAAPVMTASRPREVNSTALFSLIRDFKTEKGVEVISLGRLAISLATKIASGHVETDEERKSIEMLKGVTKLVVVNYEDAPDHVKERFNSSALKILDKSEKLMQVKDDGEAVDIYGVPSADGKILRNCVIMVPADCALICVMGSIPLDKISALVEKEGKR